MTNSWSLWWWDGHNCQILFLGFLSLRDCNSKECYLIKLYSELLTWHSIKPFFYLHTCCCLHGRFKSTTNMVIPASSNISIHHLIKSFFSLSTLSCNQLGHHLVSHQLIIPQLIYFFCSYHLSAWYCLDIVRRNSVLVILESERVNSLTPMSDQDRISP